MRPNFLTLTDGYKLDHRRQYPEDTRFVYSNFTPRASRIEGQSKVVFFGLQYYLRRYLMEIASETFFSQSQKEVTAYYKRRVDGYLGPNSIGINHICDLHSLGYIPLRFWALPEGAHVPLRVPMFTFQNTLREFYWLTNYIETSLSNTLWLPCTSATTAYRYRRLFDRFALLTGGDPAFVDWQGHDFSFRGMGATEAAALSGAGHLLSFLGTDTLPAIDLLEDYYGATIGGSVAATEHSVMCAGSQGGELETFQRLLNLYPSGVVSVVSDTWDLWKVIDQILPSLKDSIMAREGKLVIRPDSGDPVEILCGSKRQGPGVIERLWEHFGGTIKDGFRHLDTHIGAIYGDSITELRAQQILSKLQQLGFASTNVVLGIGSYTYQYTTRDTYGFAVKATWADIGGQERMLSKNPVTDDGTKKSACGRLAVYKTTEGAYKLLDNNRMDEGIEFSPDNQLKEVWANGKFTVHNNDNSLNAIRQRVKEG